ncbi:DUF1348-domain-containing protein [Acaromyces ingoldii]|uniref:DUF1348-domain-containing protein n=1 Tax=Acaromyces ingoldii TaxID=215250 RepID=A0A316YH09_9BASI|nr:DUF1348-domain-containing protein [Acaromyces ingoldii]PWN88431.1 DUF1348-domain-containing protein [Acaromyces ingoldii]
MSLAPPFTKETAYKKVKAAQNLWNTKDPSKVVQAYTPDTIWRNRDVFLKGHEEVRGFLTAKWKREHNYRLKKELFAWGEDRIAVQFWYEYQVDPEDEERWQRCYGLEDWTFAPDGKMMKRQMSGNEVSISKQQRWFTDGMTTEEIDALVLGDEHH